MSVLMNGKKLLEIVRKDRSGRTVRIAKYLKTSGKQTPLSEQIYYPDGHSILYLYDKSGEEVERVIQL